MLYRIAERVLNRPLLIHPDKVPLILGVLQGRIPVEISPEALDANAERVAALPAEARVTIEGPSASRFVGSSADEDPASGARKALPFRRTKEGVAVISVVGSLVNRGAWVGTSSGLTSYEGFRFQLDAAVADPRTRSIALDMSSPGGEAIGAFDAADAVRRAAQAKPVVAVVNGMAASAAYAIASGASRIVMTRDGLAGSIGVVLLHADFSRQLDKAGIEPTLIFAGAHKVDGNPFEPLPEAVREDMQAEVNRFYDLFVETVAAGRRGMSAKAIRATEARVFIGADAVEAGLADEVGTFDSVLADLTRGQIGGRTSISITKGSSMENKQGAPAADAGTTTVQTTAPATTPAASAPDAAAAEQGRIKAILTCEEAAGRETLAQHFAFSTHMSADDAKAALAAAPKAGPQQAAQPERASTSPMGLVTDQPEAGGDAKSMWAKATDRVNQQRGLKH